MLSSALPLGTCSPFIPPQPAIGFQPRWESKIIGATAPAFSNDLISDTISSLGRFSMVVVHRILNM
jgi:hypothetical protein